MKNYHLIIFPPLNPDFRFPELGTAQLKAFGEEKGIHIKQVDLNVEFLNYILTNETFIKVLENEEVKFSSILHYKGFVNKDVEQITNISNIILYLIKKSSSYRYYAIKKLVNLLNLEPSTANKKGFFEWIEKGNIIYSNFYENWLKQYETPPPVSVGISILSFAQLGPSIILSNILKDSFNVKKIIVGGPFISGLWPLINKHLWLFKYFDLIIPFEGEIPYLNVLKLIEIGKEEIPDGVFYKKGKQIIWKVNSYIPKIKELPYPNFDDLLINMFEEKALPVRTIKTCSWSKCNFCYHVFYKKPEIGYDFISEEDTVKMIEYLKDKYNIFKFVLSNHSTPAKFLYKFAKLLISKKIKINWSAITRFDSSMNKSFFKLLKNSGCDHLEFGLETISDKGMKLLNRPINREVVEKTINNIYPGDIHINIFILNYPSQFKEEYIETLEWILKNYKFIDKVTIQKFRLGMNTHMFFHIPDYINISKKDLINWIDPYNFPFNSGSNFEKNDFFNISRNYILKFLKLKKIEINNIWDEYYEMKNLFYFPEYKKSLLKYEK